MKSVNRINEYIKGELPEEELDGRTRELAKEYFADEDRKAKWEKVLHQNPEWQAFLKEQQNDKAASTATAPKKRRPRRLWPWLAVAASFLLALWVGNYLWLGNTDALTTDQLVAQELASPHRYEANRSGDLDPTDARQLAGAYYQSGNYTAAIPLWLDLYQNQSADTEEIFYLAMAYLYQEEFNLAVPLFEEILGQESRLLQREATWYLALSYLQVQRPSAAQALLETMIQAKGWKSTEAQKLLDTLN